MLSIQTVDASILNWVKAKLKLYGTELYITFIDYLAVLSVVVSVLGLLHYMVAVVSILNTGKLNLINKILLYDGGIPVNLHLST